MEVQKEWLCPLRSEESCTGYIVLVNCANFHPLTPNDDYSGRTAPLTSKCCISYIYSRNIGTEYFKHGINSPLFPLQNAVCFIILYYYHFIYRVC